MNTCITTMHTYTHTHTQTTNNRQYNWWADASKGGGVLRALGSHVIDLLRFLTLGEITLVNACTQSTSKHLPDEHGAAVQVCVVWCYVSAAAVCLCCVFVCSRSIALLCTGMHMYTTYSPTHTPTYRMQYTHIHHVIHSVIHPHPIQYTHIQVTADDFVSARLTLSPGPCTPPNASWWGNNTDTQQSIPITMVLSAWGAPGGQGPPFLLVGSKGTLVLDSNTGSCQHWAPGEDGKSKVCVVVVVAAHGVLMMMCWYMSLMCTRHPNQHMLCT